jgi:hypothetical protein
VYFNDYTPRKIEGEPPIDPLVRFDTGLVMNVSANAELKPGSFWNEGTSLRFTPTVIRPGPWRRIVIDVTPEKVTASWAESPDAAPKRVAEWTGDKLRTSYGQSQQWLDGRKTGLQVRPWAPQRSLGLWMFRSTMAVKNFVIEPPL